MKVFVYKLVAPHGKAYIGVSKNPQKRFKGHARGPFPIGNAIRKYGETNISLLILVETRSYDVAYKLERSYIRDHETLYPNGYNLDPGGKGQKHTPGTTLEKIRRVQTGRVKSKEEIRKIVKGIKEYYKKHPEARKRISNIRKGTKASKQTKLKMSKTRKGVLKSKEHKRKIGLSHKGKIGESFSRKHREILRKRWQGEGSPNSKLTSAQVYEIYYMYHSNLYKTSEIAKRFSITCNNVRNIANKRTWKHLWE